MRTDHENRSTMKLSINVIVKRRSFFVIACSAFLLLFVPGFFLSSYAQTALPASLMNTNSLYAAGYAVSSPTGSTKLVQGNWVVPTVTCAIGENAHGEYLVGVGGDAGGAYLDCNNGAPQYGPVFEFKSAYGAIPPKDRVSPGDKMKTIVTISTSTHVVKITLKDLTKSWVFTFTGTDSSNLQSFAFWVLLAGPAETGTPNPNFGTLKTSSNIATIGSHHGSLSTFSSIAADIIQKDTLVDTSSFILASVSSLSGSGSSFSINWIQSA